MSNSKFILVVGVLMLLALYHFMFVVRGDGLPQFDESRIQAVFLSDGQVYFGKLSDHNKEFAILRNVFYLKYGASLQQTTRTESEQTLNLVKLGGEVHGPDNEMYIAKDQILFVENLRNDSTVVSTIKRSAF